MGVAANQGMRSRGRARHELLPSWAVSPRDIGPRNVLVVVSWRSGVPLQIMRGQGWVVDSGVDRSRL